MNKVLTPLEEEYIHFVHCIEDLNDAWRVFKELQARRPEIGEVEAAAFRYALVAYARPYKNSRGVAVRAHCLNSDHVPREHLDLHSRLLTARDKIHAHSDLSPRDARLHVREIEGTRIATQIRNGIDKLEELRHLDEIVELVQRTLACMYKEAKNMEQRLPTNR